MHAEQLVQMVNDISAFFASGGTEAEAAAEVLGHLKRQWEPRMRRQLVEIWRSGGGDFSPVGRAAIALLAAATTRPAG